MQVWPWTMDHLPLRGSRTAWSWSVGGPTLGEGRRTCTPMPPPLTSTGPGHWKSSIFGAQLLHAGCRVASADHVLLPAALHRCTRH